jgi:hypothetical protein
MKLLPLLFVILLLGNQKIQAQKCKFDYEKKDPFTNKLTLGITSTLEKSWKIGFNRADNNYSIGLLINFPGVKENVLNKGDTLMIALENGDPIILFASDIALPSSDVMGSGASSQILTFYRAGYIVNIEQMRQLSLNKIIAVRVYIGTIWYTVEISEKNAQKIIKSVICILK